jgi:hypothetical protein
MSLLYRMEMMTNDDTENSKKLLRFSCEKCYFTCSNKQDYTRHLSTGKHEMMTNDDTKNSKKLRTYICSCGKKYKYRQGLSSHKKKCNYIEEIKNEVVEVENEVIEVEPEVIELGNAVVVVDKEENDEGKKNVDLELDLDKDDPSYKEMFIAMMKENKELHKTMREMIPKIGNTTNNNTNNNNTTNNNFNLNVFLNETCKDAMNIKDFIESLRVQCSEMKEIQNIGFIELASKVLLKELSEMDVSKRPIHCSDLKRETLYIKDNNVWEKESESKPTMLTMMKQMQKVSYTTLDIWISKHPGCQRYDHPQHNLFMNTWGDICILDECKDVKKISKRIAKEVLIDKTK